MELFDAYIYTHPPQLFRYLRIPQNSASVIKVGGSWVSVYIQLVMVRLIIGLGYLLLFIKFSAYRLKTVPYGIVRKELPYGVI